MYAVAAVYPLLSFEKAVHEKMTGLLEFTGSSGIKAFQRALTSSLDTSSLHCPDTEAKNATTRTRIAIMLVV